jgi:hypothetical protein
VAFRVSSVRVIASELCSQQAKNSPVAGNPDNAWNVNFNNGNDNWNNRNNTNQVRLVRAGE